MVVYDLGANVGFLSLIFARLVGPEGRVVCFEPLASNAKQIEYNARLNNMTNITVRNEAVGGADGKVIFSVSDFPTTGQLEEIANKADTRESAPAGVEVQMRSLDSTIAEGEVVPDLIKMDVEAAEVEALRGAAKLLKEKRPILIIEVHATNQEVQRILTEANYRIAVVGSPLSLEENGWNAQILAWPAETQMAESLLTALAKPELRL
jgi:FkbM family methyltransferase